ncbi:MAG: SAM-dependent methyltransferase [Chloroflexi bacterium]|nr:SAM-dependent methyltransferase [Chloroflexota bacterium]
MEEVERLIREEVQREGSISFARFMGRALLEPGLGYYATAQRRAGRSGDFMTAPELHPILGAAIAQLAAATWERLGRPATFRWREYGAGEGTLLLAALDHLAREGHPLLDALEVSVSEANPYRLADLTAALAALPGGGPPLVAAGSPPAAGIVVANEFADALPFHIVVGRAAPGGFAERRVSIDPVTNVLTWAEGAPDPGVAERLAPLMASWPPLAEGQLAELSPATADWAHGLSGELTEGVVIVLDYGREGAILRDATSRMAGTALAYQGHRATADLLSEPGSRDLTAHVDLTLLRAAAVAGGLRHLTSTNQAKFLATAGVDGEVARTRTGPAATLEGAIALRSALAQLMDPRRMGGFAVEVFVAGSSPGANALADPASPLPGTAAPNRPLV